MLSLIATRLSYSRALKDGDTSNWRDKWDLEASSRPLGCLSGLESYQNSSKVGDRAKVAASPA